MPTGARPSCRVLIATDNRELSAALVNLLSEHCPVLNTAGPASVLADIANSEDLRLLIIGDTEPGFAALDLLRTAKEQRSELAVLVLSDHPTIENATESIRRGAEDFVPVPYSEEVVRKEVARILEAAELRERIATLDHLVSARYGFENIISRSTRMRAVFDLATAASHSNTPVLILGETGTGKELIARAIHANSQRAKRPFVPVNCAALPRDLVESELFGHRRGAFSGAFADHPGLFAAAHGGSLFLDEVGELPLEVQAKLLRALQDGEVRPVGSLEHRRVDVRIVAASNRSLTAMRDSRMRQDLFYRLSVLVIEIPALRERREDLPLLIAHFFKAIRERGGRQVDGIDRGALDLLGGYPFPGNVRELENLLEGLSVVLPSGRTTLQTEDIRRWLRRQGASVAERTSDATHVPLNLTDLERWAIQEALRLAHGHKSKAAQLLGISRDTLYRKLREIGLDSELPNPPT